MASDTGSRNPQSRPSIHPLPVDSPTSACHRNPEQFPQRCSTRIVVQRSGSLVEPASVPRASEAELLEVEMMAELVTEGAQEGAERRDILTNRRSHPHANQHGIGSVVAKELECPMLTCT
jgi:hypothetical protein